MPPPLADRLLSLLEPLRVGDEVVPGVRLLGASTERGLWLHFDRAAGPVHVEIALPAPGLRYAVRTEQLYFSYRAPGPIESREGLALCNAVATRARHNEDRVLAGLAAEVPDKPAKVREVRVEALVERAGTPEAPFFTLSPYVGCLIGCRFCYAQTHVGAVRRLERLPEVPWGSYVDVRVNAAGVLARELASLPPGSIKFCPIVSDPYQAVESKFGVTRACLEVLRDRAPDRPVLVLTRSALVERDVGLLASMPRAYAGFSIPTADDAARRHFEPRASPVAARFSALERLRAAGVKTFAVVQPLLPGSIEALADALAAAVGSVRIDVLHGVEGAGADFAGGPYAEVSRADWQSARAAELSAALAARGVPVWSGELPPGLTA